MGGRLTAPAQRELAKNYFEKAREWYESYVAETPRQRNAPGRLSMPATARSRRPSSGSSATAKNRPRGKCSRSSARSSPGRRPRPAQLKRLESLVAALLDKTHRPTPLLVGLAEIQSALDRPQDSEKIYREILAKDPGDDLACNNLSMILALQKTKLDEALELIDKTIERAGPLGPFLDTRAVVLIARHEPRRALEDLESALAEKATPLRLFHKAWACHEDGNADKAKECLQSARTAGLEDSMLSGAGTRNLPANQPNRTSNSDTLPCQGTAHEPTSAVEYTAKQPPCW